MSSDRQFRNRFILASGGDSRQVSADAAAVGSPELLGSLGFVVAGHVVGHASIAIIA